MSRWPRIKLLDDRGRTMTVFERVPVPGAEPDRLAVGVVIDRPQAARVPAEELGNRIAAYQSEHGWSPDDAEYAAGFAEYVVEQIESLSSGKLTHESEILRDAAEPGKGRSEWEADPAALAEHINMHGLDFTGADFRARFRHEPVGDSHWLPTPPPSSRKARAHEDAALRKNGISFPLHSMKSLRAADFDGAALPEWNAVQQVLDQIAAAASSDDTLTLTVAQLRRLVAHR